MNTVYLSLIGRAARAHWKLVLGVCLGFTVSYYALLLVFTMVRFGEIPNYVEFHDVFHIYGLIWQGTPSVMDMLPIIKDEAWFETGYKNPNYYGVATWSYMLIPPKMLLVALFGLLLGLFLALMVHARRCGCALRNPKQLYTGAGVGSVLIALTSATLTWVVCCATPSWVVALAMLGMSVSLSLFLEPLGMVMSVAGIGVMLLIIWRQLSALASCDTGPIARP